MSYLTHPDALEHPRRRLAGELVLPRGESLEPSGGQDPGRARSHHAGRWIAGTDGGRWHRWLCTEGGGGGEQRSLSTQCHVSPTK